MEAGLQHSCLEFFTYSIMGCEMWHQRWTPSQVESHTTYRLALTAFAHSYFFAIGAVVPSDRQGLPPGGWWWWGVLFSHCLRGVGAGSSAACLYCDVTPGFVPSYMNQHSGIQDYFWKPLLYTDSYSNHTGK